MTPTPNTPQTRAPQTVMPWTRSGEPGGWRQAVVYGLGLSGRAAAQWLLERGIDVVAFDQRTPDEIAADPSFDALRGQAGLRLELGTEPDVLPSDLAWGDIDALILSPGVPADRPLVAAAKDAGLPVLAEVELAFPFLQGTVIAITGSNGKSTTTSLAAAMLEGAGKDSAACGNIGEPVIRFASGVQQDSDGTERTFVVELSSFQLESVDLFRPRAAALLNVAADHLDRYPSLDAYRRAKLNIFRRQQAGDVAILNADDPSVVAAVPELRARCRFFSRKIRVADGCFLDGDRVMETSPERDEPRLLFRTSDVPLPGVHQLENAMAAALLALAVGDEFGADAERLVDGLRSFRGLPHRLERLTALDGVTYYNDSKGTNPAAVVKSLEGFDDASVHLILGGRFKGGDLGELIEMVGRKAARVYLVGESAELFAEALSARSLSAEDLVPQEIPYEMAGTLDIAVERASATATAGQSVVLSPACSSFDQFVNFAERGKAFQALVRRLVEGHHVEGNEEDRHGA